MIPTPNMHMCSCVIKKSTYTKRHVRQENTVNSGCMLVHTKLSVNSVKGSCHPNHKLVVFKQIVLVLASVFVVSFAALVQWSFVRGAHNIENQHL